MGIRPKIAFAGKKNKKKAQKIRFKIVVAKI